MRSGGGDVVEEEWWLFVIDFVIDFVAVLWSLSRFLVARFLIFELTCTET